MGHGMAFLSLDGRRERNEHIPSPRAHAGLRTAILKVGSADPGLWQPLETYYKWALWGPSPIPESESSQRSPSGTQMLPRVGQSWRGPWTQQPGRGSEGASPRPWV